MTTTKKLIAVGTSSGSLLFFVSLFCTRSAATISFNKQVDLPSSLCSGRERPSRQLRTPLVPEHQERGAESVPARSGQRSCKRSPCQAIQRQGGTPLENNFTGLSEEKLRLTNASPNRKLCEDSARCCTSWMKRAVSWRSPRWRTWINARRNLPNSLGRLRANRAPTTCE